MAITEEVLAIIVPCSPLPWSAQNLNMDELERPKTMPLVSTKKKLKPLCVNTLILNQQALCGFGNKRKYGKLITKILNSLFKKFLNMLPFYPKLP